MEVFSTWMRRCYSGGESPILQQFFCSLQLILKYSLSPAELKFTLRVGVISLFLINRGSQLEVSDDIEMSWTEAINCSSSKTGTQTFDLL